MSPGQLHVFGLDSWVNSAVGKENGKHKRRKRRFGDNDKEFSFGYTRFEMPCLKGRGMHGCGFGGISGLSCRL